MPIKHVPGPYGTFDERLSAKFDELFEGENLVQVILHAHLLIEQALILKLSKKLTRPEVLRNKDYAQLSFAQKAALYIGLYDPDSQTEKLLVGFNKIRNATAHSLADESDLSDLVRKYLTLSEIQSDSSALDIVKIAFGSLALFELGAVHGVRQTDFDDEPASETRI